MMQPVAPVMVRKGEDTGAFFSSQVPKEEGITQEETCGFAFTYWPCGRMPFLNRFTIVNCMKLVDSCKPDVCYPSIVSDGNAVKWLLHASVWIATIVLTHYLIDPIAFQYDATMTLIGTELMGANATGAMVVPKAAWAGPTIRELYLAGYASLWVSFLLLVLYNGLTLQKPLRHTLSLLVPLFGLCMHFLFMLIPLVYMTVITAEAENLARVNATAIAAPALPTQESYHVALAVQLLSLFGLIFIGVNLLYMTDPTATGKGSYPSAEQL